MEVSNNRRAAMSWKIDDVHSGVQFSVKHLVVASLRGHFRRFGGVLALDEADLTRSKVEVSIEAASVDTGNPQRDANLRSAGFLDAEQHPTISFRSTLIEQAGDGYKIAGDLTIRGITKEVVLDAQLGGFVVDPRGLRRAGFSARASLQRSEFGMVWNQILESGGVAISDRVDLTFDIEAIAQEAAREKVA
jgi:polyisoprenoid-binding protein YceI